jgi:hypothetical protein
VLDNDFDPRQAFAFSFTFELITLIGWSFHQNHHLQCLSIHCGVGQFIDQLAQLLPNLRELSLSWSLQYSHRTGAEMIADLAFLRSCPRLTTLRLKCAILTASVSDHLSLPPNLTSIILDDVVRHSADVTQFLRALPSTLRSLVVDRGVYPNPECKYEDFLPLFEMKNLQIVSTELFSGCSRVCVGYLQGAAKVRFSLKNRFISLNLL